MGPPEGEHDMFGRDGQTQLQTDRKHMRLLFGRDATNALPCRYVGR